MSTQKKTRLKRGLKNKIRTALQCHTYTFLTKSHKVTKKSFLVAEGIHIMSLKADLTINYVDEAFLLEMSSIYK